MHSTSNPIIHLTVEKALNGWVIRSAGAVGEIAQVMIVPEDGDLGGMIAAAIVDGRLNPPAPASGARNAFLQNAVIHNGLYNANTLTGAMSVTATGDSFSRSSLMSRFRAFCEGGT